ncbi:MAG: phospholipase effector Tle1 domain-containing protein, partial [Limnohabitans sp.]
NQLDDGTLAGHQSWADNSLQVHPAVRQCLHMVAGHELRACFPLDSVRIQGGYPANVKEVVYPGSHSDVGGGYAPGDLGVGLKPNEQMSIIPGRDMYRAARIAGVPLPLFNDLKTSNQDVYVALTPTDSLVQLYNAYLRDAAVAPAPVEEMLRQHMALYQSFRFKWREGFENLPFMRQAKPEHAAYLRTTQKGLMERMLALGGGDANAQHPSSHLLPSPLVHSSKFLAQPDANTTAPAPPWQVLPRISDRQRNPWTNPYFDPVAAARLYRQLAAKNGYTLSQQERKWCEVGERMRLQALTDSMAKLFASHLHDSLAGFIGIGVDESTGFDLGLKVFGNQLGLMKFRTVFKGDD